MFDRYYTADKLFDETQVCAFLRCSPAELKWRSCGAFKRRCTVTGTFSWWPKSGQLMFERDDDLSHVLDTPPVKRRQLYRKYGPGRPPGDKSWSDVSGHFGGSKCSLPEMVLSNPRRFFRLANSASQPDGRIAQELSEVAQKAQSIIVAWCLIAHRFRTNGEYLGFDEIRHSDYMVDGEFVVISCALDLSIVNWPRPFDQLSEDRLVESIGRCFGQLDPKECEAFFNKRENFAVGPGYVDPRYLMVADELGRPV